MKQGIVQCFLNVDMRNGHDGLAAIAKDNGIKVNEIDSGSYLVFVNSQKTKLKLYAAGQVIAYLRMPSGNKINMNVIREIPTVFNGKSINYDQALKTAVEQAMEKKRKAVFSAF